MLLTSTINPSVCPSTNPAGQQGDLSSLITACCCLALCPVFLFFFVPQSKRRGSRVFHAAVCQANRKLACMLPLPLHVCARCGWGLDVAVDFTTGCYHEENSGLHNHCICLYFILEA